MTNIAVTTSQANVRTGPDESYSKIGWIKEGRSVVILGGTEKWSRVKVIGGDMDGKIGWIHDDLLESSD